MDAIRDQIIPRVDKIDLLTVFLAMLLFIITINISEAYARILMGASKF